MSKAKRLTLSQLETMPLAKGVKIRVDPTVSKMGIVQTPRFEPSKSGKPHGDDFGGVTQKKLDSAFSKRTGKDEVNKSQRGRPHHEIATVKIGIDPDTKKSGVAIRFSCSKQMRCELMTFFELFDFFDEVTCADTPHVIIEAGWLNSKSNFHGSAKQSKSVGERIAKNVGANHETGRKIVEMCEYFGIAYELKQPQSAKMKPEVFETATGIKTRNQEKIDAGVLIL